MPLHVHAPFIGKDNIKFFPAQKFPWWPVGVEPQQRSVLNEVERRRLSRRFTWTVVGTVHYRANSDSIIALLLSLRIFFVRSSLNLCARAVANILCFIIFVITFSVFLVKYKYERERVNLLLFLIDRFFIFLRETRYIVLVGTSSMLVQIRRSWQSEDEFNFELLRNEIDCCSMFDQFFVQLAKKQSQIG